MDEGRCISLLSHCQRMIVSVFHVLTMLGIKTLLISAVSVMVITLTLWF
jgi:hypothetical protein